MKLRELARNPYDLSAKEAVNPKRIQSMQMSACGIKVYAVCVCVCVHINAYIHAYIFIYIDALRHGAC